MSIITNWIRANAPKLPDGETLINYKIALKIGATLLNQLPPTKEAGSFILRSINLATSASIAAKASSRWDLFIESTRVTILAISVAGVATGRPLLEAAYMVSDVGLEAIELGKALYEKDREEAFSHLMDIGMSTLTLTAIFTRSKRLLVLAGTINMITFCALMLKKDSALASINKTIKVLGAPEVKTDLPKKRKRLLLETIYYITLSLGACNSLYSTIKKK